MYTELEIAPDQDRDLDIAGVLLGHFPHCDFDLITIEAFQPGHQPKYIPMMRADKLNTAELLGLARHFDWDSPIIFRINLI